MLRWSSEEAGSDLDLRGIADDGTDPQLPGGRELRALVDAIVLRDDHEIGGAFASVVAALGEPAAIRAAAVCGNFEMMNRQLDAMGVGPPSRTAAIAPDLGLTWPI